MKWRNAKTAPLPDKVTLFYLGNYEYVVGKVIMSDDNELLILPKEDGEPCRAFERVKLWAYIKKPVWGDDYLSHSNKELEAIFKDYIINQYGENDDVEIDLKVYNERCKNEN